LRQRNDRTGIIVHQHWVGTEKLLEKRAKKNRAGITAKPKKMIKGGPILKVEKNIDTRALEQDIGDGFGVNITQFGSKKTVKKRGINFED